MKQIDMVPSSIALPLPDDEYIAKSEKDLRVVFPLDFKDFLKRFGGGEPVVRTFVADGHEWAIDRFLCLLRNYADNPLGWYDIAVTWSQTFDRMTEDPDTLGADMIPIVVLFAGDFVCLDYRASREDPSVVVWLHEESEEWAPATRPVAATFTEFLELIK